jgi:2-iminoacetate synthase
MDRAQTAGIDDVGCGVLFGLSPYAYDFVGLLMHAEHLEARFGVGPHTISVPRIRPADDIDPAMFPHAVADDDFLHIIACIRLAVPYTGMIISTRESADIRGKALHLGISQISGGSRTSVGGYCEEDESDTAQFETNDTRSLDEVIAWLIDMGYLPSFCTACYRAGRTGDRFMSLCKSGKIHACCTPNAIMTTKEYLVDYASPATRAKGEALIRQSLELIDNPKTRRIAEQHLADIEHGQRDFRF